VNLIHAARDMGYGLGVGWCEHGKLTLVYKILEISWLAEEILASHEDFWIYHHIKFYPSCRISGNSLYETHLFFLYQSAYYSAFLYSVASLFIALLAVSPFPAFAAASPLNFRSVKP
jgi:hypothetical protein